MSQRDEYGLPPGRTGADRPINEESKNDASPSEQVSEIRQSIEQTRAEMSETIDELQERLSPSHLKEQVKEHVAEQYRHAKETVREATIGKVEDMVYETRRTIVETISANPIPSALVGIGLAWLWINGRGDARYGARRYDESYAGPRSYADPPRYGTAGTSRTVQQRTGEIWDRSTETARNLASRAGETVSGMAGQVRDTASNLAGRARETVTGVVGQAQETAGYLAEQAQYQARRVEERVDVAMRENPLAVGAIALALGTAVGLAIPQTRKENEWMGEARDNLLDKAQSVAHDTMEQVQQVAQKVTDEIAPPDNQSSQSRSGTF